MVGPGRLELPTSRLSGVRSNHLSYGPSGSRQKTRFLIGRFSEPLGLRLTWKNSQTQLVERRKPCGLLR